MSPYWDFKHLFIYSNIKNVTTCTFDRVDLKTDCVEELDVNVSSHFFSSPLKIGARHTIVDGPKNKLKKQKKSSINITFCLEGDDRNIVNLQCQNMTFTTPFSSTKPLHSHGD